MAAGTLVSHEMSEAIGKELNRVTFDVEKVWLRRFVEAVDDPNPLWKKVVPPSLFMTHFAEGGRVQALYPFEIPLPQILAAGGEWEFFRPARLADTLTGIRTISAIQEKKGKSGAMLFITVTITWTNQRGEVVARGSSAQVFY